MSKYKKILDKNYNSTDDVFTYYITDIIPNYTDDMNVKIYVDDEEISSEDYEIATLTIQEADATIIVFSGEPVENGTIAVGTEITIEIDDGLDNSNDDESDNSNEDDTDNNSSESNETTDDTNGNDTSNDENNIDDNNDDEVTDDSNNISNIGSVTNAQVDLSNPINLGDIKIPILKGDKGETGAQGIQGEKGDAFTYADFTAEQLAKLKGDKGDKGDTGSQGKQGIQGEKGDSFKYEDFTAEQLARLKGDKGDKGDKGEQGEQGIQGVQGIQGPTGKAFTIYKTYTSIEVMNEDAENVEEGSFVAIASDVEDEDNAKLFIKNADSFSYIMDLSGATGMKGEQGEQGVQGEQGLPGNPGLSAYEIAVENGFSGTEDEWIKSLKGGSFKRRSIFYTTTSTEESSFLLTDYNTNFWIDVFVNGFKLIESEYSIVLLDSNYYVVLTKPLDVVGTEVEIDIIESNSNSETNDWELVETITLEESKRSTGTIELGAKYQELVVVGMLEPTLTTEDSVGELIYSLNKSSSWLTTNVSPTNNGKYYRTLLKLECLTDMIIGSHSATSGESLPQIAGGQIRNYCADNQKEYKLGYIETICIWVWSGVMKEGSVFKIYGKKKVN